MSPHVTLAIIILFALAFDFTNGFHDTANSIATMVGTRAVSPKVAVAIAAVFNFIGAFSSLKVAATVGKGVIDPSIISLNVVMAGLVGAIAWNLVTWTIGLPSSSSHALFGGLIGAAIMASGPSSVLWGGVNTKIVLPAIGSPTIGFILAMVLMALLMRVLRTAKPKPANQGFRIAQVFSGAWLSFAHGTGDAQKTMGVMSLAILIANGNGDTANFHVPTWVIVSAATSMALGTYIGGWSIIKTLGSKIVKMEPMQGFSASMTSAAVLFFAAKRGLPVSTTHVVSGSVMGAGASKRANSVRWKVALDIVSAWVFTLPCAAAVGAVSYLLAQISPLVLIAVTAALIWYLRWGRAPRSTKLAAH